MGAAGGIVWWGIGWVMSYTVDPLIDNLFDGGGGPGGGGPGGGVLGEAGGDGAALVPQNLPQAADLELRITELLGQLNAVQDQIMALQLQGEPVPIVLLDELADLAETIENLGIIRN